MFDEVQTGAGRTGKLWSHEWAGARPDVMSLAKGLGGGFPIGACLATSRAAQGMTAGTHGSTFGGNPLAAAVSNAVLDVMLEQGFMSNVVEMGNLLQKELARVADRYPNVVTATRGLGLMLGIKCGVPNVELAAKALEHGLLTVVAGDNVLRMLPPLIVGEDHVREAVSLIERSCADLDG